MSSLSVKNSSEMCATSHLIRKLFGTHQKLKFWFRIQQKYRFLVNDQIFIRSLMSPWMSIFLSLIQSYICLSLYFCIFITLCSFVPNTFCRRCFWFFDVLIYSHIWTWEEMKKLNPTMAFWDSHLASAANSAKICYDGPGRLRWLVGYL